MRAFLNRPYPITTSSREVLIAFGYGAFTTVFLALFRPFQFSGAFQEGNQYLPAICYGSVCTACLLLMRLPPLFFKGVYEEQRWTVGKEIFFDALSFLVVGLGVWLFTVARYELAPTPGSFLRFLGMVVAIGLLPHTIFVLIKQNRLLHKYRQAAGVLQRDLGDAGSEVAAGSAMPTLPETASLILRAENPKENLEIPPQDLICIEASDNYIKVFQSSPTPTLLRSTLKRAEEDTSADPVFFRCHRGYIVNLSKVVRVSGNAQGLKLELEGLPGVVVPVSRGLNQQISALLRNHSAAG